MTLRKVRVAIFPRNLSSLVEMQQQYEILRFSRDFDPVFIVDNDAVAQRIHACGFDAVRLPEVERQDRGHFKLVSQTRVGALVVKGLDAIFNADYVRHNVLIGSIRLCLTAISLRSLTNHVQRLLSAEKIELLLLPGDRELGWVPAIIKACEKLSIPTVISLTTMVPSDPSSELTQRSNFYRFHASSTHRTLFWNRIVRTFFPDHLSPDDHSKIFSPGWLIVALELSGMSSRNPWYQGMGRSSAIFAEGNRKLRKLVAGGVSERKIVLSGSVALNDMVRKIPRKNLPQKIVVIVPSYAEQSLCDWATHLKGVREIVQTVSSEQHEVKLSLHPKSKIDDYVFLTHEFNCTISDKTFSDEMKNSDLCVCSNSSTIEVATILSIPVINYDYINLNTNTWEDYQGVIVERELSGFCTSFFHVTTDPEYYKFLCDRQREMSEDILFRVSDFGAHFQDVLKGILIEEKYS